MVYKGDPLDKGHHIASFNAKSMYPTLPMCQTSLDVLLQYVINYQDQIDTFGFDLAQIVTFMKFIVEHTYWGGGVQPHFCPWKNVCFPIFSHGEKWGKKYMEREGNEYFFPIFPHGENGKTHIFTWAKMGLDPPHMQLLIGNFTDRCRALVWDTTAVKPLAKF